MLRLPRLRGILFDSVTYVTFRIAGSSNGRTHDSESCNLGSNPSPAALLVNGSLN